MEITPYVTTDAIRAALGVTDNEVSDNAIADQMLEDALLADLANLTQVPGFSATDIYNKGTATGASDIDQLAYRLLRLYSLWYCVTHIARNWLAFPNQISDGQEKMGRALDFETLTQIVASAESNRLAWRDRLLNLVIGTSGPTQNAAHIISASIPSFDPVLGQ